jgi:uncharacterized cupredoxin-like copper-binding protein
MGLTTVGSWGSWQWLKHHPEWAATGHSHSAATATGDHPATADPAAPLAQVVSRSVAVQMDDQMRFTPGEISVQAGETIRFVVHNAGHTAHEMVLGNHAAIRAHAEAMKQAAAQGNAPTNAHDSAHSHGTGAAITVAAGQTGELVVTFPQATTLQMACLIPGHYEAGMRGTVTVGAAAAPRHDHGAHKH